MFSFKELRKAEKLKVDGREYKMAVLGNSATQFLSAAVSGYAKLEGVNLKVYDTDYNQIELQLVDQQSDTYKFDPDFILLWISTEKMYEEFLSAPSIGRDKFAEAYIEKIKKYWKWIGQKSNAKVLQLNFTEMDDKVVGQYSLKTDTAFIFQIRKLNYLLQEAMKKNCNVYPIDVLAIQIDLGRTEFYDAVLYYNAKMCIAKKALPYIAKSVIDVVKVILGRLKKCIILDLDNTLWGGNIGDDGLSHIEIGGLGKGYVYTDIQKWFKQLKENGVILAVCSKNNEETAKEPFLKHKEMILRLEDISVFIANWNDKASNIRLIQKTLDIGMDSIIFIDDSPFERNLVRGLISEIEVPELPEDPAYYLEFLRGCNYFERVSYDKIAVDRTRMYQIELERKRLEASFETIEDYLMSLDMVGIIRSFDEEQYSRIAQLSQRSNQFNLRTVRYTESEIRNIAESNNYMAFYYFLKDRLGDYGIVGVVIMEKKSKNELFIESWFMSCRALKRSMEQFIMNELVGKAKEKGFKKITAEYIPTTKNEMVYNIYGKMGFTDLLNNQYSLDIDTYKKQKTYIRGV
ncbi:MAG: HAD-IIIC family phosphatase [Dorea sp.]|nr:HAD-IIIC family phosphatase [Dorea sp.]